MPVLTMLIHSIPAIEGVKKTFPEALQEEIASESIRLGVRLADFSILPCSTLGEGIPLAVKAAKGRIDWFRENVLTLEDLAIKLNKENINPISTIKETERLMHLINNPQDFKIAVATANRYLKLFIKFQREGVENISIFTKTYGKCIGLVNSIRVLYELIREEDKNITIITGGTEGRWVIKLVESNLISCTCWPTPASYSENKIWVEGQEIKKIKEPTVMQKFIASSSLNFPAYAEAVRLSIAVKIETILLRAKRLGKVLKDEFKQEGLDYDKIIPYLKEERYVDENLRPSEDMNFERLHQITLKAKINQDRDGNLSTELSQQLTHPLRLTSEEEDNVKAALLHGLIENLNDDKAKFLDWIGKDREIVIIIHGNKGVVSNIIDLEKGVIALSWRAIRAPLNLIIAYGSNSTGVPTKMIWRYL